MAKEFNKEAKQDYDRDIGLLLGALRTKFKLTQQDVATFQSMTSTQHVSNIEKGRSPAGIGYIKQLCTQCKLTDQQIPTVIKKISTRYGKYLADEMVFNQ